MVTVVADYKPFHHGPQEYFFGYQIVNCSIVKNAKPELQLLAVRVWYCTRTYRYIFTLVGT
jgi:hypothetical protein